MSMGIGGRWMGAAGSNAVGRAGGRGCHAINAHGQNGSGWCERRWDVLQDSFVGASAVTRAGRVKRMGPLMI